MDLHTTRGLQLEASNPSFSARSRHQGGSLRCFGASENSVGGELWAYDATANTATLVRDVRPGVVGSGPTGFVDFLGRTYFVANDGVHGEELWCSDGTPAGTAMVRDIWPGSSASGPRELTVLGTRLLFNAATPANGRELWVSDGTPSGTVLLVDLWPGGMASDPTGLQVSVLLGTRMVFAANDGILGNEPWVTDGTVAGTVRLADVNPGAPGSNPTGFAVGGPFGQWIAFSANHPTTGREPWVHDGTTTYLLADIVSGTGSSSPTDFLLSEALVPTTLLFTATDATSGAEPWSSDGTPQSTMLLRDIWPGSIGSGAFGYLRLPNGRVVFLADDGSNGRELWATDGTSQGTALLKDIRLGATGSRIDGVEGAGPYGGNHAFFAADDGSVGMEPWVTDGSPGGTRRVADVRSGPNDALTGSAAVQVLPNGRALLSAHTDAVGRELWLANANTATVILVGDLNPNQPSSLPIVPYAVDPTHPSVAYLGWNDGLFGAELWRLDTASGARNLVKDIFPGSISSSPRDFVTMGGVVYFVAQGAAEGVELWRTDGTTNGTVVVKNINPSDGHSNPASIAVDETRGLLFFIAAQTGVGRSLWRSDGTEAGTVVITPTLGTDPGHMGLAGGTLFFSMRSTTYGRELWKTDGSDQGTALVLDILPGPTGSIQDAAVFGPPDEATEINGKYMFRADDGTGADLWITDGTAAGTTRLMNSPTNTALPVLMARLNHGWLFAVDDGSIGREPWFTDGTPAGTVPVADVIPGPSGSNPEAMRGYDRCVRDDRGRIHLAAKVPFTATTPATGREVWLTDGTASGTALLVDLHPGPLSGVESMAGGAPGAWVARIPGSSTFLFPGHDGASGFEVWRSDGTAAGTGLHKDIAPGPRSSFPLRPTLAGSTWLFSAIDGSTGRELWYARTMPGSVRFGRPCPGTGGRRPTHVPVGAPALGATFGLGIRDGLAFAPAAMALGTAQVTLPFGSCELYTVPIVTMVLGLDATGAATVPVPVPSDTGLIGTGLVTQFVLVDPGGTPPGLTFSGGMVVLISSGDPNQFE